MPTLRKAGIRPGDLIEITASKGAVTIRPADEKRFPLYTPAKTEAAAIRRGRAAYKRGNYITLNQLHDELESARHNAGKKRVRKVS